MFLILSFVYFDMVNILLYFNFCKNSKAIPRSNYWGDFNMGLLRGLSVWLDHSTGLSNPRRQPASGMWIGVSLCMWVCVLFVSVVVVLWRNWVKSSAHITYFRKYSSICEIKWFLRDLTGKIRKWRTRINTCTDVTETLLSRINALATSLMVPRVTMYQHRLSVIFTR